MKKVLTEEKLKDLVKECVLTSLNETFLIDKFKERRQQKADNESKLEELKGLLNSVGIENITPKTINGQPGYIFTSKVDEATVAAKQLKPQGVVFKMQKQHGYYQDNEIWDATFFATFGSYPMFEGKLEKTV